MQESTINLLIGGALGIIPSITTFCLEIWRERRKQKHEISLRNIDLVNSPRIEALREFADQFGAFAAPGDDAGHSLNKLLAAMQTASLYVDESTLTAMQNAIPVLISAPSSYETRTQRADALKSPAITAMTKALRHEMRKSFPVV